jgi:hypothetical protein
MLSRSCCPQREVAMRGFTIRCLAALAALGSVVVHLAITPEQVGEKLYVGILFVVGSALLIYAAVRLLLRGDRLAWLVGAVVSAGMIVGFLLSRTVGLPASYRERSWEVPYGPLALLFEAAYLVLLVVAPEARGGSAGAIGVRWGVGMLPGTQRLEKKSKPNKEELDAVEAARR